MLGALISAFVLCRVIKKVADEKREAGPISTDGVNLGEIEG